MDVLQVECSQKAWNDTIFKKYYFIYFLSAKI